MVTNIKNTFEMDSVASVTLTEYKIEIIDIINRINK